MTAPLPPPAHLASAPAANTPTGTFNLNGGTLTVKAGAAKTAGPPPSTSTAARSRPRPGTAATFMTGIEYRQCPDDGAKFDTNGQAITIGQLWPQRDGGQCHRRRPHQGRPRHPHPHRSEHLHRGHHHQRRQTRHHRSLQRHHRHHHQQRRTPQDQLNGTTPSSLSTVSVNTGGGFEFDLGTFNAANQPAVSVGTLNANDNYTVDIAGSSIPSGSHTITLLTYTTKTGTGLPAIGTLPVGVTVTSGPTIPAPPSRSVNHRSANLLTWSKGDGDWDTSTSTGTPTPPPTRNPPSSPSPTSSRPAMASTR